MNYGENKREDVRLQAAKNYADYTREISQKQKSILQAEMKLHKLQQNLTKNAAEIKRLNAEIAALKRWVNDPLSTKNRKARVFAVHGQFLQSWISYDSLQF